MTKTPNLKSRIEQNREIISEMLSGSNSCKRLNNINWIRYELTQEAQILFQCPQSEKRKYLDFNNIKNLGETWDYIVNNYKSNIDNLDIRTIHSMLCKNTNISGGTYRISDAYIEQLGLNAPTFNELLYRMNDIEYHIQDTSVPTLTRAFNLHYDIIACQPFNDFNKRTARMVMNWFLISNGYRPILFNKPSDKRNYMAALRARANGDTKAYSHYMYSCMLRTQREIIKQLHKSRIL